ncbi:MAG TPA: signal peptidase II [Firmicutes bacterium]|nr:signal peptidase II [Bacillota bacterium]
MRKPQVFLTGLLIFLDQSIKIYISKYLMGAELELIGGRIFFSPRLNTGYSWLDSRFNLGIKKSIYIIVTLAITVVFIFLFRFVKTAYIDQGWLDSLFSFYLAGAVCSISDRLFWGGCLDYIQLKGFFVFDLKDLYVTIFQTAVIAAAAFNHRSIKNISSEDILINFGKFVRETFNRGR